MLALDRNITYIFSESEIGAGKKGAGGGPEAVRDMMAHHGMLLDKVEIVNNQELILSDVSIEYARNIDLLVSNMLELNNKVESVLKTNSFPIILTGDHSNAIGGLSGLKNAFEDKRIGVIWIDAHADLHSPYTTPSGNMHGMPLAALTGIDNSENGKNKVGELAAYYWNELKKLGVHQLTPKFDIKDLVFIGVRDAEEEEWETIRKFGVKNFMTDDIRKLGMQKVLEQSLEHLKDCDIFYISFDADSLDTDVSVGTGTPVADGLTFEQGEAVFKVLLNHPKTAAFEITEVNPLLDEDGKEMAGAIAGLLYAGLTAE
ncbi:MAG: arginase [Bacteroidia bacterium]|nr:arginase [Bacteroidia bacterium]